MENHVLETDKGSSLLQISSEYDIGFFNDFNTWLDLMHYEGYANYDNTPFDRMFELFLSVISLNNLQSWKKSVETFIRIILIQAKKTNEKRYEELLEEMHNYFQKVKNYQMVYYAEIKRIKQEDSKHNGLVRRFFRLWKNSF